MAEPDSALDVPPAYTSPTGEHSDAPRRLRFLYLLPLLVFAGLALLFLVRLFAGDPSRVPSALIGRPVPAFSLEPVPGLTEAGAPVPGLSDADLKGRVTVVNVWASWCVPCRQEHPALVELAKNPAVRVVGINYKDNPDNARRFLRDLGNPFAAIGTDSSGRAAIDWGVYGVPETFVVGPDGTIRHKHIGPLQPGQMRAFMDAVRAAADGRG
jgi:cytochrome c biogenesis protein CcmG, thiol:disulfide interchange protein DsbE